MKLIPLTTQSFFKRAISVAEHYGFRSIDEICVDDPKERPLKAAPTPHAAHPHHVDYQTLPEALRSYASRTELKKRQTGMFYTPSTVAHPADPGTRIHALTLNTVGVHDALSEVVLIKSATSILEEIGVKKYTVRVNSIGDSDSTARFTREIGAQLRQRLHELPDDLRELHRKNPDQVLAHLYEHRHPIITGLAGPIDFLTAPSRKYFKEVLELLEYSDIPFVLDDKLYGNHKTYCHTVFEIIDDAEVSTVLARGGRYDNLTKIYARGSVPAIGIVVAVRTNDTGVHTAQRRRTQPNACLIHIGREARIKSIAIMEQFRREKIPIEQCLHFERFTEQLAYAESHHMQYVIIIGQREVQDGVVIVRNSIDRSQRNIPLDKLTNYVRDMIKVA